MLCPSEWQLALGESGIIKLYYFLEQGNETVSKRGSMGFLVTTELHIFLQPPPCPVLTFLLNFPLAVYVYVYALTCVHKYAYMCTYVYDFVCTCTYVYTCVIVCMCKYVYISMCVCILYVYVMCNYICSMWVYTNICPMYICVCMYTYISLHMYAESQ